MEMLTLIYTLPNGMAVTAKEHNGEIRPKQYISRAQAAKAAAKIPGSEVVGRLSAYSRCWYVQVG